MEPQGKEEKKALKEADIMVTMLGKRWGATGVVILAAFARPTGNPDKPDEVEVSLINVAGGTVAFKAHLPAILRQSAEGAEKNMENICRHDREDVGEQGDLPKFLTDLLMGKGRPDID